MLRHCYVNRVNRGECAVHIAQDGVDGFDGFDGVDGFEKKIHPLLCHPPSSSLPSHSRTLD